MSENRTSPDESPKTNETFDSEELADRLVNYDEALFGGQTVNLFDDDTIRNLPGHEQEKLQRMLDCLQLIQEVRQGKETVVHDNRSASSPVVHDLMLAATPTLKVGRFRIEREIGRGAHGIVYQAEDPLLARNVAIKIPRPETILSPSLQKRFVQEGRTAATLRHPNIVPVLEAGEFGPTCYIVQELCTGPSLDEWHAQQTEPIPPNVTAEILIGVANGVQHAHSLGILHRDVKPSNILLQPQQSAPASSDSKQIISFIPKLTDFGIAKCLNDEAITDRTTTGAVIGTMAYMPIEQASTSSVPIGPSSDVYSLGVVLYELLAGQVPFRAANQLDQLRMIETNEPQPLRQIRADVPADLESICFKCLEKNPRNRYASAAELVADLERFLANEPVNAAKHQNYRTLVRCCRNVMRSRFVFWLVFLTGIGLILVLLNRTQPHSEVASTTLSKQSSIPSSDQRIQQYVEDLHSAYLLINSPENPETGRREIANQACDILNRYRPMPNEVDFRGFEWFYLWRLLHPSAYVPMLPKLWGVQAHEGDGYFVTFSTDGAKLATAAKDGKACVWDANTGNLLFTLSGHNGEVNCVEFSPDGTLLATASDDKTVRLWDAESGTPIEILWKHSGPVVSVKFNPHHGRIAAGAGDGIIKIWDVATLRERATFDAQSGHRIESLVYSPDGTLLASAGGPPGVRIWDTSATDRPFVELPVNNTQAAAFSHDGQFIAIGQEHGIRVFRVATGRLVQRIVIQGKHVRSLTYTKDDSSLVIAGDKITTSLIDLRSGSMWNPFDLSTEAWCAACSEDQEKVAVCAADGQVSVWDIGRLRGLCRMALADRHRRYCGFATSPDDSTLIVAGGDQFRDLPATSQTGDVVAWDLSGESPRQVFKYRKTDDHKPVGGLVVTNHGETLALYEGVTALNEGKTVCLIDIETGIERSHLTPCWLAYLNQHANGSQQSLFATTQHFNLPFKSRMLQLRSSSDGQLVRTLPIRYSDKGEPFPFAIFPQDDLIAVVATIPDLRLELLRISDESSSPLWSLPLNTHDEVKSISIVDEGNTLLVHPGGNHLIFVRRMNGQILKELSVPVIDPMEDPPIAMSPDGRTIAIGSSHGIVLANSTNGKVLAVLPLPNNVLEMTQISFLCGGKVIVADAFMVDHRSGIFVWRADGPENPTSN